jgi:hypothetical protein
LPREVNTLESVQQRIEYEEQLLQLLEAYIPLLLDKEPFFRSVFPI